MSYKYEVKASPNHSSRSRYGHGSKVKGITIHHWGSDGQKHANVVHWLRAPDNHNSSAHYVVSDGLVTQLVDDSRAAWHSGNNEGNGTTIGIECRPEMSAGDWATLVDTTARSLRQCSDSSKLRRVSTSTSWAAPTRGVLSGKLRCHD